MTSTLIEHEILTVGFLSMSLKCYFSSNSTMITFMTTTIFSLFVTYFSYAVDSRWTAWNCETPNFLFHQLRNVNRHPQALGLWCPLLSIILAVFMIITHHDGYSSLAILIMINCPLILRLFLFRIIRKWKLSALLSDAIGILTNCYLLRTIFEFQLAWIFPIAILPPLLNSLLTPRLMISAVKSFTLGEYQLVYSGVVLALVASIRRILSPNTGNNDYESLLIILSWSIVTCVSFSSVCFACSVLRKSSIIFFITFFVMVLMAYLFCLFLNGLDMLSWVANYFLFNSNMDILYRRWIVLTFWLLCVAFTIRFAMECWSMPRLGTVHRKFFHWTIGLVVVSGLLYDPSLTVLAGVLMFDGFIVLEIMRLCDVDPFGRSLREIFAKFLDYQDQGPLILTPIYLLIGCFVPIWIDIPIGGNQSIELRHFAGLIAVGVGDAAAAVGGTYFGYTPWRLVSHSRKTVQGTLCGFIAQLIMVFYILQCTGPSMAFISWVRVVWLIWSCLLVSLLETFTAQVDNLILPLFAYLMFL